MTTWQQPAGVPASGRYPDGSAGHLRQWDGHAWRAEISTDPSVAPAQPRHSFARAVAGRWFVLALAGYAVGVGVASVASVRYSNALRTVAVIGVASVMVWFVMLLYRRLRLGEAIGASAMIGWSLVGGVVGGVVALLLYRAIDAVFSLSQPDSATSLFNGNLVNGVVEESAKLLVPVILWLTASRFRDPRAGFALVLGSAAVFGIAEGWLYVAQLEWDSTPAHWVLHHHEKILEYRGTAENATLFAAIERPLIELVHPVMAGFVAAVAWLVAWHRGRLLSLAALGAFVIAAVYHGVFDAALAALQGGEATTVGLLASVLLALSPIAFYLLATRRAGRQLTPPSAIALNARGWLPRLERLRVSQPSGRRPPSRDDPRTEQASGRLIT